jgi:hypothetical protein
VKSARKWVEMEVDMARRHGKPILGLPSFGQTELSGEARTLVDATSSWSAKAIASAIERIAPN